MTLNAIGMLLIEFYAHNCFVICLRQTNLFNATRKLNVILSAIHISVYECVCFDFDT